MWKRAFGAIIATLRGEEDMLITCLEIVDKYMSYPHGSDGLEIIHIQQGFIHALLTGYALVFTHNVDSVVDNFS